MTNTLIESIEIENPLLVQLPDLSKVPNNDIGEKLYSPSMKYLKKYVKIKEIKQYLNYARAQRGQEPFKNLK